MSDIIAAVATGSQISAIGIIRLSGPGCIRLAQQVFTAHSGRSLEEVPSHRLTIGSLQDAQGRVIDQCLATVSRAPGSYTGEDTVEFHCHGSPAVLSAGLQSLFHRGARLAGRGEFTKRAFLNGQLDLTQAEAVIDLIESETADAAANAAAQVGGVLKNRLLPIYNDLTDLCSHFHAVLDYPDEDIDDFRLADYHQTLKNHAKTLQALLDSYSQGRILRHGVRTAIVGRPNAGKSSLLNLLAGFDRAIVTDIPGTTRDTVEESVLLGSVRLNLVDTAGIRESNDPIEELGVERSRRAAREAQLCIFVCDGTRPLDAQDEDIMDLCREAPNSIAILNKQDLPSCVEPSDLPFEWIIPMSAKEGTGLQQLRDTIEELFAGSLPPDGSVLTNQRQYQAILRSKDHLSRAMQALRQGLTPDAVLIDVEQAMEALGEVTGGTVREDITARIFERFCVGK